MIKQKIYNDVEIGSLSGFGIGPLEMSAPIYTKYNNFYFAAAAAIATALGTAYSVTQSKKAADEVADGIENAAGISEAAAQQARNDIFSTFGPAYDAFVEGAVQSLNELSNGETTTTEILNNTGNEANRIYAQGTADAQSALLGIPPSQVQTQAPAAAAQPASAPQPAAAPQPGPDIPREISVRASDSGGGIIGAVMRAQAIERDRLNRPAPGTEIFRPEGMENLTPEHVQELIAAPGESGRSGVPGQSLAGTAQGVSPFAPFVPDRPGPTVQEGTWLEGMGNLTSEQVQGLIDVSGESEWSGIAGVVGRVATQQIQAIEQQFGLPIQEVLASGVFDPQEQAQVSELLNQTIGEGGLISPGQSLAGTAAGPIPTPAIPGGANIPAQQPATGQTLAGTAAGPRPTPAIPGGANIPAQQPATGQTLATQVIPQTGLRGAENAVNQATITARDQLNSGFGTAINMVGQGFDAAGRKIESGRDRAVDELGRPIDISGIDASVQELQPFRDVGENALALQANLAGVNGPEAQQEAFNNYIESSGQQFSREQQEQSLIRNQAALGGLGGGNVRAELQRQAAGIAAQQQQQQFQNLALLAQGGQQAATTQAGFRREGALEQIGQGAANQRLIAQIEQQTGMSLAALAAQSGITQAELVRQLGTQQAGLAERAGGAIGGARLQTGTNLANLALSGAAQRANTTFQAGTNIANVTDRGAANRANLTSQTGAGVSDLMTNLGTSAANIGIGSGNQLASLAAQSGNAQAAGILGQTNAITGGINQALTLGMQAYG